MGSGGSRRRAVLVHWKQSEAPERLTLLRAAGFAAEGGELEPDGLRALRADPPQLVVIDLGRLPSHGREVALALRQSKATRHVPLLFVEGDPVKVAKLRRLLPDAWYGSWATLPDDARAALATVPAEPVVPPALSSGTATPLGRKLGLKPGQRVLLDGAPDGFEREITPLPEGVSLMRRAGREAPDMRLWFVRRRADLSRGLPKRAGDKGFGAGGLWIVWPKKTSALTTDIGQADVRAAGLGAGLVDFKIAAFTVDWSGLRFSRRRKR